MIKIAHLIDGRTKTGAISSVKRIMSNYRYDDSKLVLVSYGAPIIDDRFETDFINLSFPQYLTSFVQAPSKRLYLLPLLFIVFFIDILRLKNYCNKNKIRCLHLHHFADIFQFGFLSYLNIKIVSHIRAIVNSNLWGGMPFKVFRKLVYSNSDKIIGISKASLSALKYQENAKTCIIYNGLEGLERAENNEISKLSQNSFLVGSVIRFAKLKGIDLYIDTFFQYYKLHPNDQVKFLLIAPINSIDSELLKYNFFERVRNAGLSDKLIFFEHFPDYSYIMPYIDVLYHTTLQREGFGNVVLEANWFGKPAISTPCLGVNDIIVDGESGFIMEGYNASEACRLINLLYENSSTYTAFSNRAFQIAHSDCFKISETIEKLHRIYMDLI